MALLTIEYKVVSVEYFLDKMQWYEINILMDNLNISVKNDWIIAREVMWSNLKPWSKGKLKAENLMSFPWEDKGKNIKSVQPKLDIDVDSDKIKNMIKNNEESTKQALIGMGIL